MASFTLAGQIDGYGQSAGSLIDFAWPRGLSAPYPDAVATHAIPITPSDSFVFPSPTRFLWVGSTGNVAVTMIDGNVVTINAVPSGTKLPFSVTQVRATNTSASNIVGGW
jgi:hypothetical protein